uniref:Putative secreted protein n=1 Tax=Anopheles darlingi TaxID=43151 RepID=A0A2M4D4M5_ANODA
MRLWSASTLTRHFSTSASISVLLAPWSSLIVARRSLLPLSSPKLPPDSSLIKLTTPPGPAGLLLPSSRSCLSFLRFSSFSRKLFRFTFTA